MMQKIYLVGTYVSTIKIEEPGILISDSRNRQEKHENIGFAGGENQ